MNLDPTYLRTIYDGLVSGALHKENASVLPLGLVGIYEDALPPESNVKERQKFLEFFIFWALLKKEVSAYFVAQLHGWTEERVLDYIARYSKWFNAPVSGKYVLYHERFKVYLFQKLTEAEIFKKNARILQLINAVSDQNEEITTYRNEFLVYHTVIQSFYAQDYKKSLKRILSDECFISSVVNHKTDKKQFIGNLELCAALCVHQNDWDMFDVLISGALKFHRLTRDRIYKVISLPQLDFTILYDYFDLAPEDEDKLRLFFLMLIQDRDWSNKNFILMSQKVRQIAEKDCINLGNIAPFWLIQRAKEVLYKNENIKYILDNSDSDELYLADAIQPNFSFMIDEIKDYPKAFKKAFKKALILLGGSMKLGEKDFEIIFNEISVGNLVNRDEILCRLTIALIQQKTNSVNTVNWFYWLLIKSKFEIGEHNWGRLNTFELCVLFLNKYPLTQNSRFCKEIENIAMDYQSYKKLINYMSQIYFESGQTGKAKEIILQSGSPKGEILSESTWIRQWIIHDFDKRKSKIDLLNTLDKIELYFENTTKSQNFNYADFIQSNIYVNLNKIDIVSRMEYMAEFAVRVSNNNPLSEQLILDAWDMSNEMKDWAVFFAKISVFAAALDVMSDSWINEQFKVLKRWFSKYDEDFYSLHLAENIFKTTKYRFSNSGSYQILKSKHFKIYNYLINKFPDLKDSAELEMDFNKFLLTKINNYKSIKEMWVDGRKYFNSSGPGENFILFWEKIEDTSSIFSRITKEDIRIINRISKISGARFPIERFVNNLNIKKYEYLLNLPDNYNLGYTEGLEAIAKYEKKLDFDNNFRTVFFAAMNPTSNRFKQADWTMQSISAPAFTSKKILRFEDDLVKLKSYLDIRKELLKS